jgi:hypothetical protein
MGRRLEHLEALLVSSPAIAEELQSVRLALPDAHLSTCGVYELAILRYELLCGFQGARGVADPALIGTVLDDRAATVAQGGRRLGDKSSRPSGLQRWLPADD